MGGREEGVHLAGEGIEEREKGKGEGKTGEMARKMPKNGRRRPSRENNTNKCTVGLNRARKNEDVLGLWMEGQTPPFRAPPCLPRLVLAQRGQGAKVSSIVAQLIGQDDLLGRRPPKMPAESASSTSSSATKQTMVTMPKSPNQGAISFLLANNQVQIRLLHH